MLVFKIENEFKNATVARTVRFTEALFDRLNHLAQENSISFNLLVLQCCKYALDQAEPCSGSPHDSGELP